MQKLRVLDLFSGIGGFSLGLERTGGFETVAFCEIEEFPRCVLAKHWPNVPCYDDVRTLTAERLAADGIAVDVICGGFPCQDISTAGSGAGLAGERSGLWSEIARLAGELRPRFIIVENVAALLSRGLGTVLGDLAALGYDAEWHCIPASAVGALHRRDRVWIVANASCGGQRANDRSGQNTGSPRPDQAEGHQRQRLRAVSGRGCSPLADADCEWQLQSQGRQQNERGWPGDGGADLANSERSGLAGGPWSGLQGPWRSALFAAGLNEGLGGEWLPEPDMGRVAHGIPDRTHRLKGLGNAVVPQIPELIGRAILSSLEAQRKAA
jgi:DNA (cytosine-5)-methyltransferase 1